MSIVLNRGKSKCSTVCFICGNVHAFIYGFIRLNWDEQNYLQICLCVDFRTFNDSHFYTQYETEENNIWVDTEM